MSGEDKICFSAALVAEGFRHDFSRDRKISKFERTNYWMREKLRVPKLLAPTAEFPVIGRRVFFKIRATELLKMRKALYDQTIV